MNSTILSGKSALVTGASHGIGFACAAALAQDGATVVIMGRREKELEKALGKLQSESPGSRIETFTGDALDEESVRSAVDFAHSLDNRLDILVPAVGAPHYKMIQDETLQGVRDMFELNFMTTYATVHHALPKMQRGGSIVCISSSVVSISYKALGSYSFAKAALERFVRLSAYELGNAGIRVNAVRPGVTLTQDIIDKLGVQELVDSYNEQVPLGRIGLPNDIARAVRFLAGPESDYITGQILPVDGGQDQCRAPEFVQSG